MNKFVIGGRTKRIAGTFVLVALLAVSIFSVLPSAFGHTPSFSIPSWTYISAFPNPIGVNQPMSFFVWLSNVPPTGSGEFGDRFQFTVDVKAPDGTTTTLGPYTSDPVGTIFASFTPTQVGTYTFQAKFPGITLTGGTNNPKGAFNEFSPTSLTNNDYINDTYAPSQSSVVSVTVQSQAIAAAPAYPRPTEYWTTPVSQAGQNANWEYIMGDWLATGGNTNDYTVAPQSAHIMWTKPISFGGVGGLPSAISSSNDGYYSYLSYESMFDPPIIMNGHLFYNIANPPEYGFVDVDLHTGQTVWYQNGTSDPMASLQIGFGFLKQNYPQLTYGQLLDYESPNQHGIIPYLWSTYTLPNTTSVWALYDPFTGNWICDLVNAAPSAGFSFGASNLVPDDIGSLVTYSPSSDFKTMTIWNSTAAIQDTFPSNNVVFAANGYWMWRPPLGAVVDASNGVKNYPITGDMPASFHATSFGPFGPSNAIGLSLLGMDKANKIAVYCNSTAVLGEASYPTPKAVALLGISINPATIGQVKWANEIPYPANNISIEAGAVGGGIFTIFEKEPCLWMGFSATTGQQIWTTQTPETSLHMYGTTTAIDNGIFYSGDSIGEGGVIYAYDVTNGNLLWSTPPESMGNTGYWADVPKSIGNIANGVLLWYGTEHSPSSVLEPGFKVGAINAKTGQPIWDIKFWDGGSGFAGGFAVADGFAVALNSYDNQIYAFSKGPSATTVETPLAALTVGSSLTVQGTVTDISPGTKQSDIALRFPNGVPVVSDSSETAWMQYVYMQDPKPAVSGVSISVVVIDPNGNPHNGVAASDISGHYSLQITPDMTPVTGKYTVVATFAGSNSYWGSNAESSFVVDPAPASTTPSTQNNTVDTYFIPAVIAIIIVVIIIGVLIMLMLRKRE
jgi:outer membrane protein assembly factor BamB